MKRYIITALCAFMVHSVLGQLNAPCFTIETPANMPTPYSINQLSITQDSTIIDLENSPIYALSVTGQVQLQSPTNSIARIILVDSNGSEYLVYEVNSLLTDNLTVNFERVGRETLWQDMIYASKLVVRLINATVTMDFPTLITEVQEQSDPALKHARAIAQSDTIINVLNRNLIARDIPWRAGPTNLSKQPYDVRRNILGDNNPFYNIEYHIAGYYVVPIYDTIYVELDDGYINEFDWRNRHGKNWITPAKQQWKSDCWAFASIANAESYINLFYNDTINLDLSEQQLDSVCGNSNFIEGGNAEEAFKYIIKTDLVTEACFPYRYNNNSYNYNKKCENPDTTFRFVSYNSKYIYRISEIKERIINQPVALSISNWQHVVECVGYKKLNEGDTTYYYTPTSHTYHPDSPYYWNQEKFIVISDTSEYKNRTALAIKNSWWWYRTRMDNWPMVDSIGVRYMILPANLLGNCYYFTDSIKSSIFSPNDIICSDADNDGYYFWGIGDKPEHCPSWASDIPDGDDSNPTYGALNEFGYLETIGPAYKDPLNINSDSIWSHPRVIPSDLIIPSGVTLTITSYLTMHPDATIIVDGGRLIVDGGIIRNGSIDNKGSFIIRNNGFVEICGDDEYKHNTTGDILINNSKTPFPILTEVTSGSFKRVNR